MIVADDLGWNDVSFHGSNQIPTPNIDRLAREGIALNNYYVLPICTPTRSAIMTGRYPIHTGMQRDVIYSPNPWGVGLDEVFIPQYLKAQGYSTHAIGKWHLGFYAKEFTPTYRGFDSFYGYYNGKGDYWDHSDESKYWGLDLHHDLDPVYTQWGNYSTEMYTAEAESRIRNHDSSAPLFLYLAYQAVHSANSHDPIQAPKSWINKFKHIKSKERRKFAAVTAYMDYGVGRVYKALEEKGILNDTVIVFTTDNGGPANGFNQNYASNWPLRGVKRTMWEGGVRGVGLIYSKLLKSSGRVSMDLFHCTDWLPTFVSIAGGEVETKIDGYDIWNTLQNETPSPRKEVLINIDRKQAALRVGDWKIIEGQGKKWSGWYPAQKSNNHRLKDAVQDFENKIIELDKNLDSNEVNLYFASSMTVQCGPVPATPEYCNKAPCLFNIKEDPCEFHDLSKKEPVILENMIKRMAEYKKTMVAPRNNKTVDPMSNPKLHNGVWMPWRSP